MDYRLIGMVVSILLQWGTAYWVYRDTRARKVPYGNAWIVFTFVFLPAVLFYIIYRHTLAVKIQLSLEQKAELSFERQTEAQKRRIAEQRALAEQNRAEQQAENQKTEAELEAYTQKRAEAKRKRMAELEEERREQEEQFAKTLKLKKDQLTDAINKNLRPRS
jgi:flagellar biosynthesis GTPase FlhF